MEISSTRLIAEWVKLLRTSHRTLPCPQISGNDQCAKLGYVSMTTSRSMGGNISLNKWNASIHEGSNDSFFRTSLRTCSQNGMPYTGDFVTQRSAVETEIKHS